MHAARHTSRGVYTMFWTLTYHRQGVNKKPMRLEVDWIL